MPCYHPIHGYIWSDGRFRMYERGDCRRQTVSCGQCVGCRLQRSRQWAIRCVHEAKMHKRNAFVTLTYDAKRLPTGYNIVSGLDYSHFQKFMKRLRKHFKSKVRFYMAGEYGEGNDRPHFHAILFGADFDDKTVWSKTPSGAIIYRSKVLETLWPFGFSSVGDVNFSTAAYVARYCMKKITGQAADAHYERIDAETGEVFWREPEFNRMSLKPGIGHAWFEKFKSDVFPHDHVIIAGKRCKVPRYYDELLRRETADSYVNCSGDTVEFSDLDDLKMLRGEKIVLDDNTEDRLLVKEQVELAKLSRLKRNL